MRPSRRVVAVMGACLLMCGSALLSQDRAVLSAPVFESTLENGLSVVVVPWDSPGVVALVSLVRTGSRDEVEAGRSGFAHLFEHMMFHGTERHPRVLYEQTMQRMGADFSAFTNDDATLFYVVAPARELERLLDLESDRFRKLHYSEAAFRTETQAVLGEYNLLASNPFRALTVELRRLAFEHHPYRHTTIGLLDDIRAMPEAYTYSLDFYRRYYRPENTTLFVVGGVTAEAAELVEGYYGDWEPGFEPRAIVPEPDQTSSRRKTVEWPNPTQPIVAVGYRAPGFSAATVDSAAIDVAGQLLFSETAPLFQELVVERRIADVLIGSLADHRDAYLFEILARLRSPQELSAFEASLAREIGKLRDGLVEESRLDRIKSHLRYELALSLDNPLEVALSLAHYVSVGGSVGTMNQLFAQYERVEAGDVRRVAREFFDESRKTVVVLTSGEKGVDDG